jgi:predicted PurR-regulated permease PerM
MQKSLEERVAEIEARNMRVESDKAWEISIFRRFSIMAMTYIVVGITLLLLNVPYAWLNALIPCVGYGISTLTLPLLRELWKRAWKRGVRR